MRCTPDPPGVCPRLEPTERGVVVVVVLPADAIRISFHSMLRSESLVEISPCDDLTLLWTGGETSHRCMCYYF